MLVDPRIDFGARGMSDRRPPARDPARSSASMTPLTPAAAEFPRQPPRLLVAVAVPRCSSASASSPSFIANDRPLLVRYDGAFLFPGLRDYPETISAAICRPRPTTATPIAKQIEARLDDLAAHPLRLRHHQLRSAVARALAAHRVNWLGTDDQGRDVLARLIYGFRISVLFGLTLTVAQLDHRRRRRRGPGLFRRLDRSPASSASSRSGRACRCSIC